MKVGLLNCDHVRDDLRPAHGDYPAMFRALLPGLEFEIFNVCDGNFPSSPGDCEAWMITGSKHSVYDEVDWILRLKVFVQNIYRHRAPCVGVCFGHQMIGEALGGKVEKSPNGWCVGVHEFEVFENESWMQPFQPKLNVLMSCQDQVLQLPPDSKVLARSPLCPVAIFTVGKTMLGIQGHPEFSKEYDRALMEGRQEKIGERTFQKGIESLALPVGRSLMANWIFNFFSPPFSLAVRHPDRHVQRQAPVGSFFVFVAHVLGGFP